MNSKQKEVIIKAICTGNLHKLMQLKQSLSGTITEMWHFENGMYRLSGTSFFLTEDEFNSRSIANTNIKSIVFKSACTLTDEQLENHLKETQ